MQSVAEVNQLPIVYKVVEHHNFAERCGRAPFAGVIVCSVVNTACISGACCVDDSGMQELS